MLFWYLQQLPQFRSVTMLTRGYDVNIQEEDDIRVSIVNVPYCVRYGLKTMKSKHPTFAIPELSFSAGMTQAGPLVKFKRTHLAPIWSTPEGRPSPVACARACLVGACFEKGRLNFGCHFLVRFFVTFQTTVSDHAAMQRCKKGPIGPFLQENKKGPDFTSITPFGKNYTPMDAPACGLSNAVRKT